MKWIAHPRFVRACQLLLGALFAVAAISKIGNMAEFATQIHNFRIVPVASENLLAVTLPWIELICALALLLKIEPRAGAAVITTMLLVFTAAVIVAMSQGLSIECGCFGKLDATRVGLTKVLQNLGIVALGCVSLLRPH